MVSIKGLYREGICKCTRIHLHHNHPPDEDLHGHPAEMHLSADETEITLNALKNRLNAKRNLSPTLGNQSWSSCNLTGCISMIDRPFRLF